MREAAVIGKEIGPYRILDKLGAGGMGEVYRARDERLQRDVAIKVLPASFADDPERLARFETEARAAGQLNDPHVLSVYDIGTYEGAPYLVTELLEGQSLRDRLADGPLPARKAIDIGIQIVRGLAAAHARGIVHRDLKPDNVFVSPEGRAKILDFGLARVTTDPSPSSTMATTLQATNPGTILGTAGYMAPEQVRAQPTDARSDVFSFGAILYEMLTGAQAFARDSTADTLAAILKEDPPEPDGSGPAIPPAVDRLVRRCLEKEPAERFQSARDVSFALEAIGGGTGSTSSTSLGALADVASTRPSRRDPAVFGPIVGVGLLSLVAGLIAGQLILPSPASAPAVAARLQQVTFTGAAVQLPSLSPDGTAVAFSLADAGGNDDIFLQRIGGENPVNLTAGSTADDFQPAFSPDGRSIAFRSQRDGGGLFIMGATGESVRRLTDEGFNPAWSPDGQHIVYGTEAIFSPGSRSQVSRLVKVEVATGTKTTLLEQDGVQPSWSPDGRWIAFWGLPEGTGRRVIYTMPAGGGAPTAIVDDAALNWSPVWSADGRYVYFASDREPPMNIWRLPVDPSTGAAAGSPERVTTSSEEHFGLSASAAGTFVLPAVTEIYEIRRYPMDLSTGRIDATSAPVWRTTRSLATAIPSPDGQYLAFFVSDPREDLVVMRVDGTEITRLTNDAFRDRGPAWTADSSRLYFYSDRSGQYEAWTIRRDGSGLEQVTVTPAGTRTGGYLPSPSGTVLAQLGVTPGPHLGMIDLAVPMAERRANLVPLPEGAQFFNPIAWLSDDEVAGFSNGSAPGTGRIQIYSRQAASYRPVTDDVPAGGFGLAGRTFFGVATDGRVILVDPATGRIRYGERITDRLSPRAQNAAASATGDALFVTERDTITNLWLLTVGEPAPQRR